MTKNEVRVRIAPSPTGYFHVGTARTALFNWLYARHNQGKFLLRIEDTDQERSKPEYTEQILKDLKWLGMDWDEEIVYQSQRLDIYKPYAEKLIEQDKAYRCFCSSDTLSKKRSTAQKNKENYRYDLNCRNLSAEEIQTHLDNNDPYVVRIKLPAEGTASFEDQVLGDLKKDYSELDDFIILRSDGRAIYNFAVVIDDHEMGISHVIRGNDHINNTFLQCEIYKALGWELPQFAHIPMILRPDKSKVSKRKGDKSVTEYHNEGFLPDAFFNFLALLGWSPKDDREKMALDEIISAFTIENINNANAVFDPQKLTWLNGEYIREMEDFKLAELVAPIIAERQISTKYALETQWHWFVKVIGLLKERCKVLTDFADNGFYFFTDEFDYNEKGVRKHFRKKNSVKYLTCLSDAYNQLESLKAEDAEIVLREIADKYEEKPAVLIHPTRLAVSGLTGGPSLFAMLEAIGKEKVVARINKALDYIGKMEDI